MKKIGFDAKRALFNYRGLGNYSRGIIEGIHKNSSDLDLYLYAPQFKNNIPDQRIQKWISHFDSSKKFHIKNPENFLGKIFPSAWRSFQLEAAIIKDEINLYHGLSHELPKLSSKRKFQTVVTIHDLIFIRYPEFFPWIDRMVYAKKFQYAVDQADLVIAICEQTKADIINYLNCPPEKIKIHYQSAAEIFQNKYTDEELKSFRNKYKLNQSFILNVGAFEKRKNQLGVIEAFSKIANKFDHDLVLVGQGKEYLQAAKALVQKYNLSNRVHFFNNFSFHELPLLYQSAEIFFFPSFFEGFGIPIIEALFSGTPVVTSIGSCFPESAGPHSIFIDPNQIDSMVEGLTRALSDKELQNQMIKSGLSYSEQFTLLNTTQKLIDLYRPLL